MGKSGLTLVGVLLVHKLLVKVGSHDRLEEEARRDEQLRLGVVGVVDEGFVLLGSDSSALLLLTPETQQQLTHSPPNILLARYIPIAAIILGFALKKRWSRSVTSMRNLDRVRV